MRAKPWLRCAVALAWLAAGGCTALREVRRSDYAAVEERRNVTVETRDGTRHEFDVARFQSDTLTGFRRRDVEGALDEYVATAIPLDDVQKLSARRTDWYRTLLLGGASLGALITVAVSTHKSTPGSGGTPPDSCLDPPCPP